MVFYPILAIFAFATLFLIGGEAAQKKVVFKSFAVEVERTNDEDGGTNDGGNITLSQDDVVKIDAKIGADISSSTVEQLNDTTTEKLEEKKPLKFKRRVVDESIENFRYFLTLAQIKRCPTLNETIDVFYDRLYDVKNLTGAEVERIAHYFTAVGNTRDYIYELNNVDINRAVLIMFNKIGRYFLDFLPLLYNNYTTDATTTATPIMNAVKTK